jgi:flagellar motility protein MotE (MotC chaperone)
MVALLSAVIYLGSTVAFWKTPHVDRKAPGGKDALTEAESAVGPSWEFSNPEADQLVAELRSEKIALTKRTEELNELSQRLEAERAELSQVSQNVRDMQSNFDLTVVRCRGEETANLKKLAKTYATMAPESSAKIFKELDDVAVVKIMLFMKNEENGAILEALAKGGPAESKHAALISEKLRTATAEKPASK